MLIIEYSKLAILFAKGNTAQYFKGGIFFRNVSDFWERKEKRKKTYANYTDLAWIPKPVRLGGLGKSMKNSCHDSKVGARECNLLFD